MNKLTWYFLCGILLLVSCQEQEEFEKNNDYLKTAILHERVDSSFVDKALAEQIAVNLKQPHTRSGSEIEDIITLFNTQNEPAIYVVNYKNNAGYTMISATKNYHPVLMQTDSGKFNKNCMPEIVDWYIDIYKTNIKNLKGAPYDSIWRYRQEWSKYAKKEPISAKSSSALSVEILRFMQNSCTEWQNQYCEISPLATNGLNLPTDIYEKALYIAELSLREDYMETSFIIKKLEVDTTKVEPMIKTQWDQYFPYNEAVINRFNENYPVGCVATAMAQIMKFHRKPQNYNWDYMPSKVEWSNWDVANLMLDIGIAAKMKYGLQGSGANNDNTLKAFKSFGYNNVKLVSHNQFTVKNEILNYHPVLMTGTRSKSDGSKIGHAWVCDGINDYYIRTAYYLMTLYESYEGKLSYAPHEIMFDDEPGLRYFHMNWGYSGDGNGWFINDNIKFRLPGDIEERNYSIKREDIIGIK